MRLMQETFCSIWSVSLSIVQSLILNFVYLFDSREQIDHGVHSCHSSLNERSATGVIEGDWSAAKLFDDVPDSVESASVSL